MKNTKAADTKAYIVSTVAKASVTSSKTVLLTVSMLAVKVV